MSWKYPPIHYHDYLCIDQLLSAQKMKSQEYGRPAHDEMLFIVVHQTYELWFKQLIFELDSVTGILASETVAEEDMGAVVARLGRMGEIVRLITGQIHVLETMTPLDFLDFRDMLFPASGFQSFQFRQFEAKLGLRSNDRLPFNSRPYQAALREDQAAEMKKIENSASLFSAVEKWLERTPFLNRKDFDFWSSYRESVQNMFRQDREMVARHPDLNETDRAQNFTVLDQAERSFSSLFDFATYEKAKSAGEWRMSHLALQAALFIQVYRHQPILQQPFRLLQSLIELDELMTNWRYRHALMARRMLGTKIGTGGSSGFEYLRQATEKHKIFTDLNRLTTFFIPRSELPDLSSDFKKSLGFSYSQMIVK